MSSVVKDNVMICCGNLDSDGSDGSEISHFKIMIKKELEADINEMRKA